MKNYTTLEDAQKLGLTISDYWQRDLNAKIKDLEQFKDLCKIVPMVYYSQYEGKNHFEHTVVFIEFKGVLLRPSKPYNQKTFTFFLAESLHVQNFSHDLEQPNKVGTPTEKKLNEWLTYLQQIETLKADVLAQRNNKETVFFGKIKNSGLKVTHQSNNGKRGYIQTKDFEFSYEVFSDGSINQKITLRCGNTIDDFLKLNNL